MKRIIIIILLILGIGITIFTIYYLKQDRFVVDKVIDEPVNIELETEETVDEYFNNKDYDNLNKIEQSDDEVNIERKWNSPDDKFMFSNDVWNEVVFPKLCSRNMDWMLEDSEEEMLRKSDKTSINARYYVTQNILDNYDGMTGLLSDLSYDEIINLYFNYFTEQLEVQYLFLDNVYNALYKVEIVKKDNHNKINNLILLYNSFSSFSPIERFRVFDVFKSLIKKGYDYDEQKDFGEEEINYDFIPSDEWLEKYPDYKFLGEIDKITNIDTFDNSKDDLTNYSWENKWINIVVETIEDDKYIKYYYRINYKTGDNYCLTDCDKTLVKKTMGETIEQREERLTKEQEEMEKLISQIEEETRDNRQIEDIEISNERKRSDDIDEELLNKFKEEQSKLNEEKN